MKETLEPECDPNLRIDYVIRGRLESIKKHPNNTVDYTNIRKYREIFYENSIGFVLGIQKVRLG